MVFKSIRGSPAAPAAMCQISIQGWLAKQGHPAYIPCPDKWTFIRSRFGRT